MNTVLTILAVLSATTRTIAAEWSDMVSDYGKTLTLPNQGDDTLYLKTYHDARRTELRVNWFTVVGIFGNLKDVGGFFYEFDSHRFKLEHCTTDWVDAFPFNNMLQSNPMIWEITRGPLRLEVVVNGVKIIDYADMNEQECSSFIATTANKNLWYNNPTRFRLDAQYNVPVIAYDIRTKLCTAPNIELPKGVIVQTQFPVSYGDSVILECTEGGFAKSSMGKAKCYHGRIFLGGDPVCMPPAYALGDSNENGCTADNYAKIENPSNCQDAISYLSMKDEVFPNILDSATAPRGCFMDGNAGKYNEHETGGADQDLYSICVSTIDYCKTAKRCKYGNCVSDPGTFSCSCWTGFEFANDDEQSCRDINECMVPGTCTNGMCVNMMGGYRCECSKGFALSFDGHSCSDINECNLQQCQNGACHNTEGSFYCTCNEGFHLTPERKYCEDMARYSVHSLEEISKKRQDLLWTHAGVSVLIFLTVFFFVCCIICIIVLCYYRHRQRKASRSKAQVDNVYS